VHIVFTLQSVDNGFAALCDDLVLCSACPSTPHHPPPLATARLHGHSKGHSALGNEVL
jgi:hypothetical protein